MYTFCNLYKISKQSWSFFPQIVYFNWGKGQPYPHKDGQDCVEIGSSRFEDGKWEDIQCIYEMKFICEKPGTASTKGIVAIKV